MLKIQQRPLILKNILIDFEMPEDKHMHLLDEFEDDEK